MRLPTLLLALLGAVLLAGVPVPRASAQGPEGDKALVDTFPRVAGLVILGFLYPPDLLPKTVSPGTLVCVPSANLDFTDPVTGKRWRFVKRDNGFDERCLAAIKGFRLIALFEEVPPEPEEPPAPPPPPPSNPQNTEKPAEVEKVSVATFPRELVDLMVGKRIYPPVTQPVRLPVGTRVCVPKREVLEGPDRKWVFAGWSNGDPEPCTRVEPGDLLLALYEVRYRVQVLSPVGTT